MPNWATGSVAIRGKTEIDIRKFLLHFLFDERSTVIRQSDEDDDYPYFARSFLMLWNERDFLELANKIEKHEDGSYYIEVDVQFAFSAYCCILEGEHSYLIGSNGLQSKEIISLKQACQKHNVKCEVYTHEPGCCFQEHIVCDENGNLVDECKEVSYEENKDGSFTIIGGFSEGEDCYTFKI